MLNDIVQGPSFSPDTGVSGGPAPAATPAPSGPAAAPSGAAFQPPTSDTQVTFPGAKEPVRWGDFPNRYVDKGEFTRVSQQAAELRRQLDAAKAAQTQARPQGQPTVSDFDRRLAQMVNKPYVSGQEAVDLIRQVVQGLQARDVVISHLHNQMKGLGQTVSGISGRNSESDERQLFGSVAKELSLPDRPVFNELMLDIYRSHEGDTLNQELVNLVRNRVNELRVAFREMDRAEADAARNAARGIPGPGGAITPSLPPRKGFEDVNDLASRVFKLFGSSDQT